MPINKLSLAPFVFVAALSGSCSQALDLVNVVFVSSAERCHAMVGSIASAFLGLRLGALSKRKAHRVGFPFSCVTVRVRRFLFFVRMGWLPKRQRDLLQEVASGFPWCGICFARGKGHHSLTTRSDTEAIHSPAFDVLGGVAASVSCKSAKLATKRRLL